MQDLEAGPIRSVSFSRAAPKQPQGKDILDADYFTAPDFLIGSTTGNIVAVRSRSFEDAASEEPTHKLLVQVPAMQSLFLVHHKI